MGIPFHVQPFFGTDQDALTYVLSVNQHRRDLSKSQRAAVAATLIPHLSAGIQAKRAERIRQALLQKGDGRILANLPGSSAIQPEAVTARAIAADIMGVSERYVADALRLQREAPDAFAEVRAGKKTLNAALTALAATSAAAKQAAKLRALQSRVNVLTKRAATDRAFFARLEDLVTAAEQDQP